MSNAALWLVALGAGVGIALAVSHADAAEPAPESPHPLPDTDNPPDASGEATTPGGSPGGDGGPAGGSAGGSAGGPGGAGSGAPTTPGPGPTPNVPDPTGVLPTELQMIYLSGLEVGKYVGLSTANPGGHTFHTWVIEHTINDMTMTIYVSTEHPDEWVSAFWHDDPPGSEPAGHFIVYMASETPGKDWMLKHLLRIDKPAPPDFT